MSNERPPKSHGMIFSRPLIPKLLDGSKAMTRRLMDPQPIVEARHGSFVYVWRPKHAKLSGNRVADEVHGAMPCCIWSPARDVMETGAAGIVQFAPIQPGDTIWVRETWQEVVHVGRGQWNTTPTIGTATRHGKIIYATTTGNGEEPPRWRSPIHMPRWASRILLEVVAVRVERVGDITEHDAIAEGAPCMDNEDYDEADPCGDEPQSHRAGFIDLWQILYGEWTPEKWVWVYEFKKRENQ